MKLSLYLDEDTIARSLVVALRARGADVQTAIEAGLGGNDDPAQLRWAASNNRALYTFNVGDFCKLHRDYVETGMEHAGIIVVPRQRYTVKQQIRLLSDLVKHQVRGRTAQPSAVPIRPDPKLVLPAAKVGQASACLPCG